MKTIALYLIVFSLMLQVVWAQAPQENNYRFKKAKQVDSVHVDPMEFKTKLFPSMIVPAVLIGWGISTIKSNGIYSSYKAKDDVQRAFPNQGSHIDNYLQFSPYAEFAALIFLKIKCRNDMINTTLLIAKSEAIMLAIVYPLKYATKMERPDGSDNQSFPSGHTAEAFVAATIVYREFRYRSPWYGVGAYALASTVGVYRMINNKHWESDVFVGAGVGMLATNIVYATHLHRWGRKEICLVPTFNGYDKGLLMVYNF